MGIVLLRDGKVSAMSYYGLTAFIYYYVIL